MILNDLSSNAGLFAHAHRRMGVFCVRTHIFLIMILNVQRQWIICAYEQVSHRDTDVFFGTYADIPIMILIVQRWIICAYEQIPHRDVSVICVRTQVFIIMVFVFQCWVICAYNQVHRGCILRTYADIPNNYLSSNAILFAQVHRHTYVRRYS